MSRNSDCYRDYPRTGKIGANLAKKLARRTIVKIKYWYVSFLLIAIIAAACGPAVETDDPSAVPAAPETEGVLEVVTQPAQVPPTTATESAPPPDAPEAYPAQPTAVPLTEGYPAPSDPIATIDPYPEAVDGFIWMLLPVGVQCEDEVNTYTDLQDALAGLTAVNVRTGQSEITELIVCTACGCPTSAHYRVQVSVEDVNAAQALGWKRE
jgi:hypothetical protein